MDFTGDAVQSEAITETAQEAGGNFLAMQGDLLFSTVERVRELRRQIGELNLQIRDTYEEARKAEIPVDAVKWLLVDEQMPVQMREQREERDAGRERVKATYLALKARRDAEDAAKAAKAKPVAVEGEAI